MIVKLNAVLSVANESLSKLDGLSAELWDVDSVSDDLLGTATLRSGRAEFIFDLGDASSADSPLETEPDLFLRVRDGSGRIVFDSETHANVRFQDIDEVSGDVRSTRELVFVPKR
jgi:hypothetical protein